MKIFSQNQLSPHGNPVFVLYLDTEKSGKPEQDTLYAAADATNFEGENDPEKILGLIIPLLSELIYAVYGEKPDAYGKKEPLTNYSTTGFDPNYPNGVNTGVYDK
jgi:hypothetical protein